MRLKELQKWFDAPHEWAQRLEAWNPALGRRLLSYASHLSWPQLLGAGLRLVEWSDDRVGVEVQLAAPRLGVLATAAEFMLHALLSRHLPTRAEDLASRQVSVRMSRFTEQPVRLKWGLSAAEREAWFQTAFRSGRGELKVTVPIWSVDELRLGEIELTAVLSHKPALPGAGDKART